MNPGSSTRQGVGLLVRGLRKSYDGHEVLKGIDFEVKPGEMFVIMGPSGSGKSVLLRQLIGLETPDAGKILIDGQPIHAPDSMSKYRVAMVFQSGGLFDSLTVAQNVGFYLAEHRLKPPEEIAPIVARTLDLVGLKGIEDKMPDELSGGMRKRVAIARSLVVQPQLILYDEPTTGLDPLSSVEIADLIVNLRTRIDVTSVVVTHDRELAFSIADRIALLEDGQIIAISTPDDLKRNPNPRVQEFLNAHFANDQAGTGKTSPAPGLRRQDPALRRSKPTLAGNGSMEDPDPSGQ